MILINGCSYSSLPGQWQDYFDIKNTNLAKPGNNNETIFHDTIEELSKNKNQYRACIIVWTFLDRYLISTDKHEEISIFPFLDSVHLKEEVYETQLFKFKKILYSYFHSDVLQQKRLDNYKKSIDLLAECKVIHIDIDEFLQQLSYIPEYTKYLPPGGHLTKDAAIQAADKIKEMINNIIC